VALAQSQPRDLMSKYLIFVDVGAAPQQLLQQRRVQQR
jgi:hypothetical protein